MPRMAGELLCLYNSVKGPRGIEFARYSIHIHALRNYAFVKLRQPERMEVLVPEHIRELARRYSIDGERLFDI